MKVRFQYSLQKIHIKLVFIENGVKDQKTQHLHQKELPKFM